MVRMLDLLLNKLSASSFSFSSQITLKEGQLLTGKIIEIFSGGTAAVSLRNGVVTAKLDAALQKGKPYVFEVISVPQGGQPVLKAAGSIQHEKDWTLFLSKMGLPQTAELEKAVELIDEQGLPITKKLTVAAAILLKMPEQNEHVNKLVLQKISSLPLPPAEVTVKALKDALNGKHLQEEMQTFINIFKSEPSISKIASKTLAQLEYFLAPLHSGRPVKEAGFTAIGSYTAGESENSKALTYNPKLEGEAAKTPSNASSAIQHAKDVFSGAVERFLKSSGLNYEFQSLHEQNTDRAETLKQTLLRLTYDSESAPALKAQGEYLLSKLTGLQLLNTTAATEPLQQIYMQIPLPENAAAKQLSVIWEGKKETGNKLDKNFCRIWLWLELEQLKEIGVDINIQKNTAAITIYSSYIGIEQFGRVAEEDLKRAMQRIGYNVSSIIFKQQQKEEASIWNAKMNAQRGLDVKI